MLHRSIATAIAALRSRDIYLVIFALAAGQTGADIKHNHWVVGGPTGNLAVSPASQAVTLGTAASVNVGWSGLTAGTRYLGVIAFGDGTNSVGRTIVSITG
jgi:hypothetical protein